MTTDEFPSYMSATFIAKFPFFGYVAEAIGSIFVDRSDPKSREHSVTSWPD
jgi:hypothetical protein